MKIKLRTMGVASVALLISLPAMAQVVPGFIVEDYAYVADPVNLTIAPDGVMYTGRDNTGSGGTTGDAVKIHRIGVGGAPVVEYGVAPLSDPDAVLFDAYGWIADTPGSVLVAGAVHGGLPIISHVSGIRPDETIQDIFATTTIVNPNYLMFDGTGRLLIIGDLGDVWQTTGAEPTHLFDMPVPSFATLNANDDVYSAGNDGVIRIYDSFGTLIDDSFVTGLGEGFTNLAFGPGGGVWGTYLYGLKRATGELIRIDDLGNVTVIGTGFDTTTYDMQFGPDGALYATVFGQDKVIRIIPEPATLTLMLIGGLLLHRRR
jgi:hypothetical protein